MQGEVQNKDVPQYRRIATLLIKIIGKPKWTLIGRSSYDGFGIFIC